MNQQRLFKRKIIYFVAIAVEAHLVEQVFAEACALDGLEKLLGNDHVGIDVDLIHRRGDAGQCAELFHRFVLPLQTAHIGQVTGNGGGGGHGRAEKMGPAVKALAALEVAVRCRCATLSRF